MCIRDSISSLSDVPTQMANNSGYHGLFTDAGYYRLVEGGGHFIHLSFMAPGVDLHDGDFDALKKQIADKWGTTNHDPEDHYTDFFQSLQKINAQSIYIDGAEGHIDGFWNHPTVPGNANQFNTD